QTDGYLNPQYIKDYNYLLLDKNIGYLQYLQYRLPTGHGFINCYDEILNDRGLFDMDLDRNNLGLDRRINVNLLNINCEYTSRTNSDKGLVQFVQSVTPKVDLVLSSKANQDYINNLIAVLKVLKLGGTYICKINENEINDLLKYLYLTTLSFETITLFKPFLEDLNEPYSYIICENFKNTSIELINILSDNHENININPKFIDYVQNYFKDLTILKESLTDARYYMYKCLSLMNLF